MIIPNDILKFLPTYLSIILSKLMAKHHKGSPEQTELKKKKIKLGRILDASGKGNGCRFSSAGTNLGLLKPVRKENFIVSVRDFCLLPPRWNRGTAKY